MYLGNEYNYAILRDYLKRFINQPRETFGKYMYLSCHYFKYIPKYVLSIFYSIIYYNQDFVYTNFYYNIFQFKNCYDVIL